MTGSNQLTVGSVWPFLLAPLSLRGEWVPLCQHVRGLQESSLCLQLPSQVASSLLAAAIAGSCHVAVHPFNLGVKKRLLVSTHLSLNQPLGEWEASCLYRSPHPMEGGGGGSIVCSSISL